MVTPLINIKKRIAVLLALIFCISCTGCGVVSLNRPYEEEIKADTTDRAETTAPPELDVVLGNYDSAVENYLKRIGDVDYKGATVKLVTAKKNIIIPTEDTGKVVSEDLTERNSAVESTLNVTLLVEEKDAYTMLDEAKAAVRAGDFYAHAVMYPQNMIGSFVTSGVALNMKSLPGFETDIGYFYSSAVAAGTGGDAIYAVAGPASLNTDKLSAVYFNKTLVEKAGLPSPYSLVDSGEWTIDKYIEYITKADALEGEYYGFCAGNPSTYLVDLFYFGSGHKLTESYLGYYPSLNVGKEGVSQSVEKIRAATDVNKSQGSALTAVDIFKSGNTLFLIDTLDTMRGLTNSSVDWGILPIPKANAQQEKYVSLAFYENAMFFSALPTTPDYELTADLITCINILSYGYTTDAYVTNAAYYHLRDNQSIRMLAAIVENPAFDLAYSFASTNEAIPSATYIAIRNAVSGVATVETYINRWKTRFENAMYKLFDTEQ